MPRVAAIDVGSNAVRLVMVELSRAGLLRDSEFHRYPLRLGTEVFAKGALSKRDLDALVDVFVDINQRLADRGIARYRAVGTAALREAANRDEVVARIERRCGIHLEIIDGQEESRLSRNALWRAVGWAPEDTLLLDIGGGTIELERANRRARVSLPLGTVRLLERWPELAMPLGESTLRRLVDEVSGELGRLTRMHKPATTLIGTGGNLASLAQIVPDETSSLPAIAVEVLPDLMARMAKMTRDERVEVYGLRPDRAELVVAGMVMLTVLIRRFGVRAFIVPGTGLRESVLHELTASTPIEPQARAVLGRLGRRLREPEARARMVRQIFEITASLHKLWEPALVPLLTAAYLMNAGESIDPAAPHEHTAYLIRHTAGLDLDDHGRAIAACTAIAACDGAAAASMSTLSAEDRTVVQRTSALLRLAVAIVERRGRAIRRANTLRSPLTLDCGISEGLPPEIIAAVEHALACQLRVI